MVHEHDPNDLVVQYLLKVIILLEQFPCPDLVISLAETAIAKCPEDHKVGLHNILSLFYIFIEMGRTKCQYK